MRVRLTDRWFCYRWIYVLDINGSRAVVGRKGYKDVANFNVMWCVFVFFSADIGRVVFSCNVFDFDCTGLDLFTDGIFMDLDVAEACDGHAV